MAQDSTDTARRTSIRERQRWRVLGHVLTVTCVYMDAYDQEKRWVSLAHDGYEVMEMHEDWLRMHGLLQEGGDAKHHS